ncbi:Zinc finger, RING-type [Corchorus olitorius]|uniref:RING-type E3 ubiquitin transferase n=1 Tax=Corchorus olitorius TaxID=93759 RepID=A0A1R3HG07_9ROSI|nr:Zinc finger, RING-type [Corchorus olitorius]
MAAVSSFRLENLQHNVIAQPALIIPSPAPTSEVQLDVTMSFRLNFSRHGSSNPVGPLFKRVRCSIDNPALASWNLDHMILKLYQELQTDFNFSIAFEHHVFPEFDYASEEILRNWDRVRVRVGMTNFTRRSMGTIVLPVHAEFSGTVVEYVQEIQSPPIVQQITNYDEDSSVIYDDVGIGPIAQQIRNYNEDSSVIYDDVGIGRAVEESALEFERTRYGMVPATESSIKRMLKNVINVEQGKDCMVCLEQLEVGSCVSQMPCSHDFHADCIQTWLKQSHYCPICRFEMPTERL